MEGRQPNRHGESLNRRQKQVMAAVGVLLLAVLAGVSAWAIRDPGTYGRSGHGCVTVNTASTTGGALVHECGSQAKALCLHAFAHQDKFSLLTQRQCRIAGLGPAAMGPDSAKARIG